MLMHVLLTSRKHKTRSL